MGIWGWSGAVRTKLAFAVVASSLAACGESTPNGPTDLPLTVADIAASLPDGGTTIGDIRLVVSVTIVGGPSFEAMVDTGSSGLQLVRDRLPAATLAALKPNGEAVTEQFPASGVTATGQVATVNLTLGDRTTSSPIAVVLFDQFVCSVPSLCSTDGGLESYVFSGYPALLGVGMRSSVGSLPAVGNPIVQLPGQPSFIVEAPAYGGDAGLLRIGPTLEEAASYHVFQLATDTAAATLANGTSSWNDLAVPACVNDQTANADYCGNAILDTGTAFVDIVWPGVANESEFPPGDSVTVSVGTTTQPLAQFSVSVGPVPEFGLDLFLLSPASGGLEKNLILGLPLFFHDNILFDQAVGQIGLLPH